MSFMDRRLFLPAEWADDGARRREAGVPEGVVFRTKPELALEMLTVAVHEGVPFCWVGGDSVYGDSPTFVQGVRQLGKWYVVDTSADARVWTEEPQIIPAEQRRKGQRGGRPYTQPLVVGEAKRVDEVIATLPAKVWRRVTVAEGSQGPRVYEYAEVGVWFSEEGLPGPKERLLVRRSIAQEPELKYHRSNAAVEVPLEKLAAVRGTRWTIEEDIQSGKGECGLDEYETRGWVGWHHHTALSLLALAFLVLQKQRLGEKRGANERARSPRPVTSSVGSTRVGQRRNTQVVPLASTTQQAGHRQPLQAASRRAALAVAK
jgi:SRSO17 transposase